MPFFTKFFFILICLLFLNSPSYCVNSDDEDTEEATKETHPVNVTRRTSNGDLLVQYTQGLTVNHKVMKLDRKSTRQSIRVVTNAASKDNSTHLVAQGFSFGDKSVTYINPLTTQLGFPGVPKNPKKKMDWVSKNGKAKSNPGYYVRTPIAFGGHAEPKFVSDLEAAFKKSSDAVVRLFTPPTETLNTIDMCGIELFGPYDMCDKYNGKGKNKYNCVGVLTDFRNRHQYGNQSISKAIRDKLKDRFRGKKSDVFVLIYNTNSPYENVDSYTAEDDNLYYDLSYSYAGSAFSEKSYYDETFELSQCESVDVSSDLMYGYIHQIGNRTASYQPNSHLFSFADEEE